MRGGHLGAGQLAIAVVTVAAISSHAWRVHAQTARKKPVCSQPCMVAFRGGCCPADAATTELPAGGCADLAACVSACDAGDGLSCARAGRLSQPRTMGGPGDDARAYVYFDKGCALGNCAACWLGCEGWRRDYQGVPGLEAALARDEGDCRAGEPNACRKLARLHTREAQYATFEQRACDLGSAEACAALAEAYGHPLGAPFGGGSDKVGIGDPAPGPAGLVNKLLERACALGRVASCLSVGYWRFLERAEGSEATRLMTEHARSGSALLEPLCRRGEAEACRTMGDAYDELSRQPAAPPGFASLAFRHLDHACSMGDAEGCRLFGVLQLRAQGWKGDTRAAAAALQRSCFLGSGRGCVAQSQITADRGEAQHLIDLACEHGQRGLMGIYSNAGMPELPQPLNCARARGAPRGASSDQKRRARE